MGIVLQMAFAHLLRSESTMKYWIAMPIGKVPIYILIDCYRKHKVTKEVVFRNSDLLRKVQVTCVVPRPAKQSFVQAQPGALFQVP